MTYTEAGLKRYYAERAREYERVYAKPERQPDLKRLELRLPELFAGCRLLDVACGTGYWTRFIAQTAQSIVAVDASAETLDVATEKTWPSSRVIFRVADAYALPDDLGTFDAAFAGFWWSHIPIRERSKFLRSLDGRLAPGAQVVLLDNLFVEGSSTPIAHRDPDGNTYQRRRLPDASEHIVLKNFPSEAELCADLCAFAEDMTFTAFEYYWLFCYKKRSPA